jgi:hypothetical protein
MRRIVLSIALSLALFASLGGAETASAQTPWGYFPTVVATRCTTVGVAATVAWAPMGYGTQFVDYSYGGAFHAGGFHGMGPYPASTTTVVISNLTPGTTVTIRVNTMTSPVVWVPTRVIVIRVPVCQTFVAPIIPVHPLPMPYHHPHSPFFPHSTGPFAGPTQPQSWGQYYPV